MSLESEVAALTVATTNLLNSVTTNKTTLDAALDNAAASAVTAAAQIPLAAAQVTLATAQVALATVQSDAAQTQANASAVQAAAAATSAAAASTAKDLAITAWAASTSPAETLAAISQSLHIGAVVKAIVYDTSKDSDGGAWRKRCADKSWYTETLGGDRWIGQHATISAAWAAAGSTTGAVYQASVTAGAQTSGLYYTPTSSTTVAQVYRGVTREFPAVAGIVAESARVVIYDLATGAMWMVLVAGATNSWWGSSSPVSSVAALSGALLVSGTGIKTIDFIKDEFSNRTATGYASLPGIASRNTVGVYLSGYSGAGIINNTVNDIAITVLDTAPIDPATGLPVPTIAVATAGGVSVIKDDGTVVSLTITSNSLSRVALAGTSMWVGATGYTAANLYNLGNFTSRAVSYFDSADSQRVAIYYVGRIPQPLAGGTSVGFSFNKNNGALGTTAGISILKENPATPTKGMVAYITNAYNSGWLPGDIRGAYLADSVAGSITAATPLNDDFSGYADDAALQAAWNVLSTSTPTLVSGGMRLTLSSANGGGVKGCSTVIGKTYTVQASFTKTSVNAYIYISNNSNGSSSFANKLMTATGAYSFDFVATATTTYIAPGAAGGVATDVLDFDNISVKLAEPDRSVKNKGLILNGTLTKTAVASGASLVAYSGFSASNYLEQPYNSDLDFGTGDFCVMGWVNLSYIGSSFTSGLFSRALSGSTGGLYAVVGITGNVALYGSASTSFVLLLATTAVLTTGVWNLVCVRRLSGVLYIDFNGINVSSVADTTNLTYASTALRLGLRSDATNWVQGSLALWRISATAPSADQIAHIYRTELPLFQANAQCCIAGTSTAVTALAYDEDTDLLHVGTSWGRSGFKDLLRIDSDATTTGALTSLSAAGGVVLTGGTSAKIYQPALLLRDEIKRKSEARKALGSVPVFFDYTATASQTAFVVPKGYKVKALYKNGVLMRETTTGVYWTRSNDGFAETCTLSTGATVSDWISIMCVRA